ncbi:hypothetical protein RIR_jg15287.t1 [Rhizophagus irregularis DAOM 181602=DAOM 197198]|nr:hypothetical protein RIR_jg15287.t1 [Rhizophagus irregularis DAOM 181602=DAOM 197198]
MFKSFHFNLRFSPKFTFIKKELRFTDEIGILNKSSLYFSTWRSRFDKKNSKNNVNLPCTVLYNFTAQYAIFCVILHILDQLTNSYDQRIYQDPNKY